MKFETGDQTDQRLIQALQYEYRRSTDAFADFLACAPVLVTGGGDRDLRYAAYNTYARLLHHLYELLMGCAARRRGDTRSLRANEAEALITDHLQRILTARRTVILAGRAQPWENGLEAYPETAPSGFASAFRRCRNITQARVAADRSTLDLSDFYQRNPRLHRDDVGRRRLGFGAARGRFSGSGRRYRLLDQRLTPDAWRHHSRRFQSNVQPRLEAEELRHEDQGRPFQTNVGGFRPRFRRRAGCGNLVS